MKTECSLSNFSMEEPVDKQALTARKRKRIEWWERHAPKAKKVQRKPVHLKKPLRTKEEKPRKGVMFPEKEESLQNENTGTNTLDGDDDKKSKRYILFIGNLPFTVKEEDVRTHFRCTGKGAIKEFRLMTKKTGESKGCGFLEFNNKGSYWKALNLHHSVLAGRKINVEVTCGGGGKGEQRKKRLKERKTKFRQKRRQKSKTVKAESKQTQDSSSSVP